MEVLLMARGCRGLLSTCLPAFMMLMFHLWHLTNGVMLLGPFSVFSYDRFAVCWSVIQLHLVKGTATSQPPWYT